MRSLRTPEISRKIKLESPPVLEGIFVWCCLFLCLVRVGLSCLVAAGDVFFWGCMHGLFSGLEKYFDYFVEFGRLSAKNGLAGGII